MTENNNIPQSNNNLSFWALVGDGNTRKSSTLRALTGISRAGVYQLQLINGQIINAYIETNSPQERSPKLDPKDYVASILNAIGSQPVTHIITPLRHRGFNSPPTTAATTTAQHYINHFVSLGWNCLGVATTKTTGPLPLASCPCGSPPHQIPLAPGGGLQPSNAMAADLRQQWGIV